MSAPSWFKRILHHYGIAFEEHHHPPVFTASELAHLEHVTGYRVAKTVVLSIQQRPLMVVLPSCFRLDLSSVEEIVGDGVRLANEAEIQSWFPNCPLGAVPPLRLRKDQYILMDRGMAHLGLMVFPAGSAEDAALMRFRDWYRMVRPGVGRFALPFLPRQGQRGPASVLVVEDEPVTNVMLCRMLQTAGYQCHSAHDGRRALELARQLRPAAIVLDLMLPDMSGFEVYTELRKQGLLRHTAVVVVTALNDAASLQRGVQLGIDAYLIKPVPPETLVQELAGVLADARS